MRKNAIIIVLTLIIAGMAGVGALERMGSVEWLDRDYETRYVKIPCIEPAPSFGVKDSFIVERRIKWELRDSVNVIDSINYILQPVFPDKPVGNDFIDDVDTGTTEMFVASDTINLGKCGSLSYAILSGGPVYQFLHQYSGSPIPDINPVDPLKWEVGVATGFRWDQGQRMIVHQVHGGYKWMRMYYQTTNFQDHTVLVGATKRF